MGFRRNGLMIQDQISLSKKSVVVGWILLILGLIGVILALVVNPTWQHNKEIMAEKEYFGIDTPEEHATLDIQMGLVLGGLLVGTPILLVGAYLVAIRTSYNRRIEGAFIQKAMQPSQTYQPALSPKGFCLYCGDQLVSGREFCPKCGKSRKD